MAKSQKPTVKKMTILEKIVAYKKKEVTERKSLYPVDLLKKSIYFSTPVVSLTSYLLDPKKSGIIAEFKRRSPSKGNINPYVTVEEVSIGYMQAGASALSVLTDEQFFGGSNADLIEARKFNFCPILRKEFIIDEYQIYEAKSIGADAILLIAECLSKTNVRKLAKLAKSLGLEVLMEIHSEDQLEKLCPELDLIGVNNRNLKTFKVSIQNSIDLFSKIPTEFVRISESGINDPKSVVRLKECGYQGFLIGEHFMKSANPGRKCANFVRDVEGLKDEVSRFEV